MPDDAPQTGGAVITANSLGDLKERLKRSGFDWAFVRSFVLPEWWEDRMADVPANRALAEAHLSRHLGFGIEELRSVSTPLRLRSTSNLRFKRYRNEIDDRVRASAQIALAAATAVVRSLDELLPPYRGSEAATRIREAILRGHEYVDLGSLLDFCWDAGIFVLPLAHLPKGGKRFDGLATFVGPRPVIVLASGRSGAPWTAFHLAHELGHVELGHVSPGTEALVDGSLAGATGPGVEERDADGFALEVLTGFQKPTTKAHGLDATQLALTATRSGPRQGVDPGVFALIYAKSNQRWPVAQNALKILGLDAGGRHVVGRALWQRLEQASILEADETVLRTLDQGKG